MNYKLLFKISAPFFLAFLLWEAILELTVIKATGYLNNPTLGRIYKEGI